MCLDFPAIVDDSVALEPDKSFFIAISRTEPDDPKRVALSIDEVEIIIVDDDGKNCSCFCYTKTSISKNSQST